MVIAFALVTALVVEPSSKMGKMGINDTVIYQRPLDSKHPDDDEKEEIGEKHFVIPEGVCAVVEWIWGGLF